MRQSNPELGITSRQIILLWLTVCYSTVWRGGCGQVCSCYTVFMSAKKPDSERIRDVSPMGVRLPGDLKQRIADAAKIQNVSMNTLVVSALEEAFPEDLTIQKEIHLTRAAYLLAVMHGRAPEDEAKAIRKQFIDFISSRYPKIDPEDALKNIQINQFDRLMLNEVTEWNAFIEAFGKAPSGASEGHS